MICTFNADNVCNECQRRTRFPSSVRSCCGSPGCRPSLDDGLVGTVAEGFKHLRFNRGPGTELHALLGKFGLTASGGCKCRSRVAYMDANGCDWCEANIDEIVGWLRESAADRGLPFVDMAGRLLVRRAIANARRKEAARGTEDRPPFHA